jgi:hypothetical protein
MENYNFRLASKGKSSCPACGKKTFVLYEDTTGKPLHETVGKCDRADHCAHHYTPRQYFSDNGIAHSMVAKKNAPRTPLNVQPPSLIDAETLRRSLCDYSNNSFVQWLRSVVGATAADVAVERYRVGTSEHWPGATVFWQIDISGNIYAGKVMLYGVDGHRRHDVKPAVQWVHSLLKLPDYNLSQHLFGEHLLADESKHVAIVESEKTAIVASIYLPDFIWLACGGSEGLSAQRCAALKGRKVGLFPDAKMFDKWSKKAQELSTICEVDVSPLLENRCTADERERGVDLADFLVLSPLAEFDVPQPVAVPPQCSEEASVVQGLPDAVPCAPRCAALPLRSEITPQKWDSELAELEAFFATAELPASPIKINAWTRIVDVAKCVEADLATAKANNGNDTFLPSLTRLKTLRELLNSNTTKR